jgi:anaerobic magnesium-protoporphyrin IX monomethyl ester cyclase
VVRVALVNPPWAFEGSIYFGCREPHLPLELGYTKLVVTAPSYLFWRCAPPELATPMRTFRALRDVGGLLIGAGPHCSTTPRAALRKLGADVVVIGECEEIVPRLVETPRDEWESIPSIAYHAARDGGAGSERVQGGPHAADLAALPALAWDPALLARHAHHHHRFDRRPPEPGGELEASRGCPYHCTFCAKENYRDR